MMKANAPCNYRGADWLFIKADSEGLHLKSTDKHLEGLVVPHKYKEHIHDGFVPHKKKR